MKNNLLMNHFSSEVNLAKKFFDGYLTEEELQEKQFEGRYWVISSENENLYILLDNDNAVSITRICKHKYLERVCGRDELPIYLREYTYE